MTVKDLAIQTIQQLPDDADWALIEEKIHFIAGLRKGVYEFDQDEGITHAQVKEEIAEWNG